MKRPPLRDRMHLPERKDLAWRILEFSFNLLEGDGQWAERRFILIVFGVLAFTLMGRATEQIQPWAQAQQLLAGVPGPLASLFHFALSFLHPQSLRHVLPPLVGCALAVLLASNFVRDLFELPNLTTGRRYLMASMFGWDYPSIKISGGGYEVSERSEPGLRARRAETNPIPKIGGPGYVRVAPGNVALFERVGGPSKVAGAGTHFIRRFETLREVVDLRDQFRTRDEVKALTKDGIPITVRDLQVSFRVRTSSRPRTTEETYPFSIAAIRRIAYGKTVGGKGPSVWTDSVPKTAVSIIRSHLSRALLDDITAKPENESRDPREKIKADFDHRDIRKRFFDMGVELLWVSLGYIETPQDVLEQRIRTWEADWQRQDRVKLAEGEAHKLRMMEYSRTLARLDFIERIVHALPRSVEETPSYDTILIQFAEALSVSGRPQSVAGTTLSVVDVFKLMQRIERLLLPGGNASKGPILQN